MSDLYTVAVVGAYSGRVDVDAAPAFQALDLDDFDAVMARIAPVARLDLPFCEAVEFRRRGDFHPDSLLDRIPGLALLVAARRLVDDPEAMHDNLRAAGVDLEAPPEPPSDPEPGRSARPALEPGVDDSDLLASMLDPNAAPAPGAGPAGGGGLLDRAVREIVAETGVATDFSEQDRWRSAIDAVLTERLRAVLTHPAVRRLEARWIEAFDLVRAAAQGDGVRVLIADLPQETLQAEYERGVEVRASALAQGIAAAAPAPGERGADLIVTDYTFEADAQGLRQLARLTELTEAVATPVLASAGGSASEPERASEAALTAWHAVAQRPGAHLIGLCAPRVLLRIPYGADSDAIETFDFEELDAGAPDEHDHLWSGAAGIVARAAIRARALTGDVTQIGRLSEVADLPMHVGRSAEGPRVVGPIDPVLTEPRLEAYELMGLIPVTGVRGQDVARILSLRSLAGEPLIGFT